jgi:hypothetical protein
MNNHLMGRNLSTTLHQLNQLFMTELWIYKKEETKKDTDERTNEKKN